MKQNLIFLPLLVALVCPPELHAEEVAIGDRLLRIPDGYEIERVAGPDLVERPIAVSFDNQGALYVTDSAGMSDRADKQLELKPHRIRKLIDNDDDGIYDESILFADGMMFPEGCLWYEGSLYVAAPPHIWKLTDTNHDGQCDQREIWFDGKTLTGCGNDLHGPYLGPDGWFYWCKGAFAEQNHTINGQDFTTRSSHIFRALPDGSRMEAVLTGGMDNPVNVAFLPNGERFLSCTFFQHPANGQRDGLIHSIYGGVYGKKHDSIYEHPMSGSVMPVMTHMGAAAPCGLLAVGSRDEFFGTQQPRLFACYFNLHQVVEHILEPQGSTFRTRERALVDCDHPDFHPTDVQRAADDSLLIVDTGGWYKICCPTSQLAKPDVFGGIYRLRKSGLPAVQDPRGRMLPWDELSATNLVDLLDDPRKSVRDRAVTRLRRMGQAAIKPLRYGRQHQSPNVRLRTLRVLSGMNLADARNLIREGADDSVAAERNAALADSSLWRDHEGLDRALKFLRNDDMRTARLAAEAAGRLGDRRATPELVNALTRQNFAGTEYDNTGTPVDPAVRVQEHALINALIELGDARGTRVGLTSNDPRAIRGALVALDQMPGDHLDAVTILPFLKHAHVSVSRTAAWIVGHHSEWGQPLAAFYETELANTSRDRDRYFVEQLGRLAKSEAIQELLSRTLGTGSVDQRLVALQAMTLSGLSSWPVAWLDQAARSLPKGDPKFQTQAIAEIRQWPLPDGGHPPLSETLLTIAHDTALDDSTRLDALQICSPLNGLSDELFSWLLKALSSDPERGLRTGAARVLAATHPALEQQWKLLPELSNSGPFELAAVLPALASDSEEFGHAALTAVENAPGFQGLRVDQLNAMLAKCPKSVQAAGKPLLKKLNASVEQQTAHLEELLANIKPGNARRGHEIFNSKQAKCITCHTRAYHGGRLGPDLTNIGRVRNTRDLLEAIVYPSASHVRGYEPVTVLLTSGQTASGIIRSEDQNQIVLALDAEKLQSIKRSSVEEVYPTSVSLMPQGMDKILSPQDLSDLITFLQQ